MEALTDSRHGRAAVRNWPLALVPLLLTGFCGPAMAFGVGEPQLLSGYGEPLRVRVPLSLETAEERNGADSVHAELIPENEYARYGVAEQALDPGLIYAAGHSDGERAWIELGSRQPMSEPAAILLLRVRLGTTLIVKEVPLLFDFKVTETPSEGTAPADAGPAIEANAVPAAPAGPAAPAPAPAVQAAVPRQHHARRATAAPAVQAAETPAAAAPRLFQLSPGLHYSSASAGLRLAESFDSLAGWQQSHPQAPEAPPAPAPLPAVQPAAPAPQPRLPVPASAARIDEASGQRGWITWLLGAAAVVAALLALWRRRARPAQEFVASPDPEPVTASSGPALEPAALLDETAAPIRERLRKLSRGRLDQDLARRALLVDAFLDLKRYDSAERLLKELEQDLASGSDPRPGLANVAAAVRR
jgi:hypothetical protein